MCSSFGWAQTDNKTTDSSLLKVDVYQTLSITEHRLVLQTVDGKVSGRYVGMEIQNKWDLDSFYKDTIYYVAELAHLVLSKNGNISFTLTSFKVSANPPKIDSYGIVHIAATKDGGNSLLAALSNYQFWGKRNGDKIVLKRVGNSYFNRCDEFVFTKVKVE